MKQAIYTLIIFSMILCGCSSGELMKQSLMITPGQSKEDVLSFLGPPGNRQFQGKDEAWQWCSTGMSTDDFLVVWFYDNLVTGITSYNNSQGYGDCGQFYRTIKWEDAPDRSIEIRKR